MIKQIRYVKIILIWCLFIFNLFSNSSYEQVRISSLQGAAAICADTLQKPCPALLPEPLEEITYLSPDKNTPMRRGKTNTLQTHSWVLAATVWQPLLPLRRLTQKKQRKNIDVTLIRYIQKQDGL